MTRRLVITYLVLTAFALVLLAIPLGTTLAHHERDSLLSDIEADADTMSALVAYPIDSGRSLPAQDLDAYARRTGGHVIVVNTKGIALVDTQHPEGGRDYSQRPEIRRALAGQRVEGQRHSNDVGATLLYAAVPTNARGRVNGAVRITYTTATLDARVHRVWARLALLCLGVLAATAVIAYALARSVTRRVDRLDRATDRLASGDFSTRVEVDASWPELQHLAESFNRMATRVSALMDSQQRFVADASHQLRTPLTALRLRLENMDADVSEHDRRGIEAAAAEVERMSRLVDALLFLARDEATARAGVAVDVAAVARDRADVWADVARERDVTVDAIGRAHAWATATPGAVEQLVDNLVDNALNVAPSGSRIVVRVDAAATTVTLHVIDEGPGLDAESRRRAFDRFWRAADAPAGGAGLGLAIVRQLAEVSGGRARLDARPEGGLDAVVELRAAPAPATGGSDPELTRL